MRRFVFRLETVLRHRETLENLREQEFAQAQGHLLTLQARLTGLREEFDRVLAGRPGRAGEHFDAHTIFDRERYLEVVQAAIGQQQRRVETAQIVAEEKRQSLMTARQARQSVSQLREKDLSTHTALAQKVEQDGLDELATLRHVRATMRKAA
jgi:flagellar FliJ protein